MRILHVLGKLDRGGVETWLVQTLRHIDRSKYTFDFMVHADGSGAYDDEVKTFGARVIPCLAPSNPIRFGRKFLRILREYGPYDCVHSHVHHFSGYVMLLAALGGVPVRVAHSHTAHKETNAPWLRKQYLTLMKFLIRKYSTKAIAVSTEAGVTLFGTRTDSRRWEVQPLGIDFSRFAATADRQAVRKSLDIAPDALVIGNVGRFVEAKNHSFLVTVAQEVLRTTPNSIFVLVGDGPLRQETEESVVGKGLMGRFRFTGIRGDVPQLLAALDVFLFPSLYEGFPLALIEAQAAGLQCLISDVISAEAEVAPSLVHRLSLSEPPHIWAEKIAALGMSTIERDSNGHIREQHSITSATRRLCLAYERSMEHAK